MAANFWESSHFGWLCDRRTAARSNSADADALQSARDVHRLRLHFVQFIQRLGKGLQLRNRVVSTAIVYFKRIYLRRSFLEVDPRPVAPTVVFMASKAEECGVNATKVVAAVALLGDSFCAHLTADDILRCEFESLGKLQFDLVVFHPYRDLVQLVADAGVTDCLQTAWNIVNDSYRTDVCLVYPPHLVAVAAIYMACTFLGRNCQQWMRTLNVSSREVFDIARDVLNLYDACEEYAALGSAEPLIDRLTELRAAEAEKRGGAAAAPATT